MALLLRGTAWLSGTLTVLMIASILAGHFADTEIVTGNMEIESQVFTIYVEDRTHNLRVTLEGTRCFEALPPWVYPEPDAIPITPPGLDYGRFFAERVMKIMDVLARCRP
jgi:hypothetical protein